ncbi:MAG: SCO family protein [Phycisphaerales bacterium]
MNRRRSILAVLATTGLFLSSTSLAQETSPATAPAVGTPVAPPKGTDPEMPRPREVQGLEVEERVGLPLPMELQFTTSDGRLVQLGDYFKSNKPAVIAMVYYKCPVVCDIVMQRLTQSFSGMDYVVGEDFNALYFSFDSSETVEDAAAAKRGHLSNYGKPVTPSIETGWQFHLADADSARQLADALGFKYRRLANGQFSHPAAIFVITPEGRISRYMYGYDYPSRDMKLSLIDATNGKLVKSLGDRFLSWCYMYDPSQGKYSLAAMRVMQLSGVISALCVAALVGTLFVGERIRRRLVRSSDDEPGQDPDGPRGDPPSNGATA